MTLELVAPAHADNTALAAAVGAVWFLAMLVVVLMGAKLTVHAQLLMSGIELVILLAVAVAAVFSDKRVNEFSWSWLGFDTSTERPGSPRAH